MSDPVTNVEIEDVLSSIRRLVSNEDRVAVEPPSKPVQEPEKLVLTPSLRIDEAKNDPLQDLAEAPISDQPEGDDWNVEAGSNDDDHHDDLDSVDSESTDDTEMEFHDWPDENSKFDDQINDADTSEAKDEVFADNESASPDKSSELMERVAEFEQLVARRKDQWEPDGQTSDDYSGGPVEPLPWEDYDPEDEGNGENAEQEDSVAHTDDAADQIDQVEEPDSDVYEADASSEDTTDEYDFEEGSEESSAEDVSPLSEEADVEFVHESADSRPSLRVSEPDSPETEVQDFDHQSTDSALEADDFLQNPEDTILDEDALRDLVAEIVRQELQGALGERITRNVRKLVRREIHRALTSQDLD